MKNKKGISIRINKRKVSETPINQEKDEISTYKRPSVEEYTDDSHYFAHHPTVEYSKNNKRQRFQRYKPFLVSAMTAIVIGSLLGFFMIQIFVDLDNEEMTFNQDLQVSSTKEEANAVEEEDDRKSTGQDDFKGSTLTGYVVQAGIFTSKAAAETTQSQLDAHSLSSMIWEKEDKYHIFVGVHSTSEASKAFANNYKKEEIELYGGKPWAIEIPETSLPSEEQQWLQEFDQLLETAISDVSSVKDFEKWLEQKPESVGEELKPLTDSVAELITLKDQQSLSVGLLNVWHEYAKSMQNL
ncbi:SPOR domain-containing protein [Gracilibacillus sp. YIM 98692]|uniref:SPOR domain-containing protein n=1 Tax=Gracilibacillus sp. YIM 98692 TaxID=2663532 RepID=UPI0013D4B12D|nr:SPOR domain-containing protein [Gracilibacillus sp. YIM 98692]